MPLLSCCHQSAARAATSALARLQSLKVRNSRRTWLVLRSICGQLLHRRSIRCPWLSCVRGLSARPLSAPAVLGTLCRRWTAHLAEAHFVVAGVVAHGLRPLREVRLSRSMLSVLLLVMPRPKTGLSVSTTRLCSLRIQQMLSSRSTTTGVFRPTEPSLRGFRVCVAEPGNLPSVAEAVPGMHGNCQTNLHGRSIMKVART